MKNPTYRIIWPYTSIWHPSRYINPCFKLTRCFSGNIPIDGIDDEVDQLNRAAAQPGTYVVARKTTSPGPYNRSMSPQHSQYYMANQQATSQKLSRMQTLARYN